MARRGLVCEAAGLLQIQNDLHRARFPLYEAHSGYQIAVDAQRFLHFEWPRCVRIMAGFLEIDIDAIGAGKLSCPNQIHRFQIEVKASTIGLRRIANGSD